jgi:hypothetical protein
MYTHFITCSHRTNSTDSWQAKLSKGRIVTIDIDQQLAVGPSILSQANQEQSVPHDSEDTQSTGRKTQAFLCRGGGGQSTNIPGHDGRETHTAMPKHEHSTNFKEPLAESEHKRKMRTR